MATIINSIKKAKDESSLDFILLFVLLILLGIGLVALSSASSYTALTTKNDSNYYFTKQLIFAVLGIVVMLLVSKINFKRYEKIAYLIYIAGIVLMILVSVPGLGVSVKGATRWLNLGFTTLQPSELMKPALVIALSAYISNNQKKMNSLKGYIIPVGMILLVCVILYFQSHLSAMIIMIVIGGTVMFASGLKLKKSWIIVGLILIAVAIFFLIFTQRYRWERVLSQYVGSEDITGGSWQPTQSLYAIGSGGLFGAGMGQSRQKYLWLPEAQNDFVFSIFAEEFGFIGCIIVIALFMVFIYRSVLAAFRCRDLFGVLISTGITGMFAFQIIINIAVVTKLIPTTGMSLPFFSYGGTSLVVYLASVGIILNVSRKEKGELK